MASPVTTIPKGVWKLPLGERVRWARRRHANLSHDALVEKVGSSRSHIIRIEKGLVKRPRADLRRRIADACGVPRELFTDEEDDEEDAAVLLAADLSKALLRLVRTVADEATRKVDA